MNMKICPKCNIEKPVSKFFKDKSRKSKLTCWCKECLKKNLQQYRKKNRKQIREKNRRYYQQPGIKEKKIKYQAEYFQKPEIKEKMIKYQAEYFQNVRKAHLKSLEERKKRRNYSRRPEVKERRKEYQKEYYQRPEVKKYRREYNKEYQKEYQRKGYNKKYHKEYLKEYLKEYNQKPEVIKKTRQRMRKYRKLTRHTNPQIRLNDRMSGAICESLKGNKNGRHWEDLVGYTLQELKIHLEKKFDLFMNWENQGSYWHIDHIKPKSLFTFITPEDPEFKECWALNNLQPLEASENIRKSNKFFY